jgi:HPt (histidine-containing phosphotransfer) domain-containing protein
MTVDLATFEELKTTAGADFVRDLVETFLTEAPAMLADLRRSFAANDADRFRRAAHSLKSNSNTFGATALAALAKKLELDGIASARESGGAPLDALDSEYERVAERLTELARA